MLTQLASEIAQHHLQIDRFAVSDFGWHRAAIGPHHQAAASAAAAAADCPAGESDPECAPEILATLEHADAVCPVPAWFADAAVCHVT